MHPADLCGHPDYRQGTWCFAKSIAISSVAFVLLSKRRHQYRWLTILYYFVFHYPPQALIRSGLVETVWRHISEDVAGRQPVHWFGTFSFRISCSLYSAWKWLLELLMKWCHCLIHRLTCAVFVCARTFSTKLASVELLRMSSLLNFAQPSTYSKKIWPWLLDFRGFTHVHCNKVSTSFKVIKCRYK